MTLWPSGPSRKPRDRQVGDGLRREEFVDGRKLVLVLEFLKKSMRDGLVRFHELGIG